VLALELDDEITQRSASIETSAAVDELLHIFVAADGRRHRTGKIGMDDITND
jgi:hypothetical protein